MKLKTASVTFFVTVSLTILSWGGFGRGAIPSCMARSPLSQLDILSTATAEHKRVSLLDLCDSTSLPEDWKAIFLQDDIGEAPTAGTEKYIQPDQLKNHIEHLLRSRGLDPSSVEISLPERIVVRRHSVEVSREQIETIYRDFILAKAPWDPHEMDIHDIYCPGAIEVVAGELTTDVSASPRERFLGNVGVTISFFVDGERQQSVKIGGKVDVYRNVVRATHPLRRGDVIREEDIDLARVNIADAPDRFSTDPTQVVGKRLLRSMGVHQPIILTELTTPLAFKKGTPVTIEFDQPGLRLTAKGEARQDGSVGKTIRVVNVMTNRTIFCRVVDSDTVQAVP